MDIVTNHVKYCLKLNPDLTVLDENYLTNRILALVGDNARKIAGKSEPLNNLECLIETAINNGKITADISQQQSLAAQIMDLATPFPSKVNQLFWQKYRFSPIMATDWFYHLSCANNYIQTRAIAKNQQFIVSSPYGNLEITINLAKPEKDPRKIAAARAHPIKNQYPECQLCFESEGYEGRANYPARCNHRLIRFKLDQKVWGLQYSPYAYFKEHAIFIDQIHEPMAISRTTFKNLIAITQLFPNYFVGSNADIPIVGGSILDHEHYQGGRHNFPMFNVPLIYELNMPQFPQVTAGIGRWPMSLIRLISPNPKQIVEAADLIRQAWLEYSDKSVKIQAYVNHERKHTVTPIAHRQGENYILELVLRDNQTNQQYPDGIFHPHPAVQHIKKENIGLIEVMGLAILPGRLLTELNEVKKFLLQENNHIAAKHLPWAQELREKKSWNQTNIDSQLRQEVGNVFEQVLEDAGVFKQNPKGQNAFLKFCRTFSQVLPAQI